MEVYNKLVRDNIADIINNNGKGEIAITKILDKQEYKKELLKKLHEEFIELNEAINSGVKENITEESADLIEVIRALNDDSLDNILEKLEEKRNQKGGFSKKLFLEKVIKKDK